MNKLKMFLLILIFLIIMTPLTAGADVGPKPSVTVNVNGVIDSDELYITLLSKKPISGPYSKKDNYDDPISKVFDEFKDDDGYYFIDFYKKVEDGKFVWSYYPPRDFKILIYNKTTDSFVTSVDELETFAFKTHYNIEIPKVTRGEQPGVMGVGVKRHYNFVQEFTGLALRILLTIGIEIAIALLFGFRLKKQLETIVRTNIFTQGILNIFLFIALYFFGSLMFLFAYVILELLVFVIEAIVYRFKLKTAENMPISVIKAWTYSFVANAASLAIGILVTNLIPGLL